MLTLKRINKEITKKYPGYDLVKGQGYFWIDGPNAALSPEGTSIYVYSLNEMTLEQWIDAVDGVMSNVPEDV